MLWYAFFYVLGIAAAVLSPSSSIKESLEILGPVTLTALFASLLVPFAGFAKNERWQKFVLQYALIPLFGMYTVVLWEKSSIMGMFLLFCASGVHAGYWMSGIHSRAYRLEQFRLGFAPNMPVTARLIAMLNGQGRSNESDMIVSSILNGKQINWAEIVQILLWTAGWASSQELEEELKRVHLAGLIDTSER
ncbi:MAG: hypothetical protein M3M85_00235 [bacterium]|nr:hypothetical protein [bacterium]